jgi:DNA-binding beta-propeller fold protein YncE
MYVVEGRASRVTVFKPDGSVASTWGSQGDGDGQFREPWGIAIAPDGNVYVADTWNHRIQYFDPNGSFLGKFGRLGDAKGRIDAEQGIFWGPRAVAVSRAGEVFVTDTGNKRIQVFTLNGEFKRMFGGEGSEPGLFREQVGIALDANGNVWVADTWNSRIQQLDPNGQPLAAFPVPAGWESQNVANKPYIAVDQRGRIAATFPEQGRVLVFSATGEQVTEVRPTDRAAPVGVSVAPDGRLIVADARGNVVQAFSPLP